MLGRHQRAGFLGRRLGPAGSDISRVRLRRGGQVNGRLDDSQFAFGAAEEIIHILGRQRLDEGLRVGHAHVLGGEAHQAAHDIQGLFPGHQHARQPIERGVHVRAAQRLVERADQVVVPFPILVIDRWPPLHRLGQTLDVERLLEGLPEQGFGHIEEIAAIAIGHRLQGRARLDLQRQLLALHCFGAGQKLLQRRLIQPV